MDGATEGAAEASLSGPTGRVDAVGTKVSGNSTGLRNWALGTVSLIVSVFGSGCGSCGTFEGSKGQGRRWF